nr:hypothetical protein [Propionibacteriaceae bacterium]
MLNSTISGNTGGTGIDNSNGATLKLINSTVTGNKGYYDQQYYTCGNHGEGASGVENLGGAATVRNSIIADSHANALCNNSLSDVRGQFTSEGHNLIGDAGPEGWALGFDAEGDQVGGGAAAVLDPELLPLADNGGPTFTQAPAPGSPAIDAGSSDEATDQR